MLPSWEDEDTFCIFIYAKNGKYVNVSDVRIENVSVDKFQRPLITSSGNYELNITDLKLLNNKLNVLPLIKSVSTDFTTINWLTIYNNTIYNSS